jgi:plasmid maintenance system killer protein
MLVVEHADQELALLETDRAQDPKYAQGVGKRFRFGMQIIRTVKTENDLYRFNGLHYKRLKRPGGESAVWLNDKWRLEMIFSGDPPNEKVRILRISNHYDD